jgi:2-keto-4-pentenoate hydratase/2-oxohepta-3-ene-1,7-dioic acid hydratase in catechol pathway
MRWATITTPGGPAAALLVGDMLHAARGATGLLDLLGDDGERLHHAGESARSDPAAVLPTAEAILAAPIPVPPSIRDFMAFEEHVVNARGGAAVDPDWYERPVFYFSNPAAVHAPGTDVAIPPGCVAFDYEVEVAAVVGRGGADLAPDQADAHIAGYTILCDWSARDLQAREMRQRLGPAKGKDSATTLGPYLVTPDELTDRRSGAGYDLAMTAAVNGRTYTDGNWQTVHWSFGQLLSYASRGTRLVPGDVLGSGTVGGGCILELSTVHSATAYPWLVPGDDVSVTVERLGSLSTHIVASRGQPIALGTRPMDTRGQR